MAVSVEGPR